MRCSCVTVLALWMGLAPLCGQVSAGPWARDAGDIFVSFQISAEESPTDVMEGLWEPETYFSGYAEAGLGRSLTFGLDVGGGEVSRQVVGFLRYTLTPPDAVWQIAVDAGMGARRLVDDQGHGLVRIGVSLGRGFGDGGEAWYMPLRHQGGWVMLDAVALYDLEIAEPIFQTEATVGFSLSDRASAVFQLKAEDWPLSDPLVTFAPSFVFQIRPGTSLQLGARAPLTGSDRVGLSLSLWQEF
jgi:hypothetical protein